MKINESYLKAEVKEKMIEFFDNEGYLSLSAFFEEEKITKLLKVLKEKNFQQVYLPEFMSRSELNLKESYDTEILELTEYLKSSEFLELIEEITGVELDLKEIKASKYKHGDYIILNDHTKLDDEILVIYDLSPNWDDDNGGVLTLTGYEEEYFYLNPDMNNLTIMNKDSETMKYLKYINKNSKNKEIIRFEMIYDL